MRLQQAEEMAEALTTDNEMSISSLGSYGDEVAVLLYQALLTTRLQLKIAMERLAHIASRCPNTEVDCWYMNQANVALESIKELNHG